MARKKERNCVFMHAGYEKNFETILSSLLIYHVVTNKLKVFFTKWHRNEFIIWLGFPVNFQRTVLCYTLIIKVWQDSYKEFSHQTSNGRKEDCTKNRSIQSEKNKSGSARLASSASVYMPFRPHSMSDALPIGLPGHCNTIIKENRT